MRTVDCRTTFVDCRTTHCEEADPMFGTTLSAHTLANVALVGSYSIARRIVSEGGGTDTKFGNMDQLLAWEKQAALMLAVVLAIKVALLQIKSDL